MRSKDYLSPSRSDSKKTDSRMSSRSMVHTVGRGLSSTPLLTDEGCTESSFTPPCTQSSLVSLTPPISRRPKALDTDFDASRPNSCRYDSVPSSARPELSCPNTVRLQSLPSSGKITPSSSPLGGTQWSKKRDTFPFPALEKALSAQFTGRQVPGWLLAAVSGAAKRVAVLEDPITQVVPQSIFSMVVGEVEEFLSRRERNKQSIRLVGTDSLPPMERLRANKAKPRERSPENKRGYDVVLPSRDSLRSVETFDRFRDKERTQPDPNDTLTRVSEILRAKWLDI